MANQDWSTTDENGSPGFDYLTTGHGPGTNTEKNGLLPLTSLNRINTNRDWTIAAKNLPANEESHYWKKNQSHNNETYSTEWE